MKKFYLALMCSMVQPGSALIAEGPAAPLNGTAAYTLAPDDKIHIGVFGEDNLTGEYVVRGDGTISFPLVGAIKVDGLTLSQLEALLTSRLAGGYLQNPRLTAEIKEYRPFYILGEVERAGQYPYRMGMTVNAAVATAGNFSYRANKRTVAIQHRGEAAEHKYKLTPDLRVQPGDTIRVLERFF
jgi:protein involved in polysaccharide export with SLBB domain